MANAKKCDRCNNYFDSYGNYTCDEKDMNGISFVCVDEGGTKYKSIKVQDLCKECLQSFKEWWNETKITLSDEQVEGFATIVTNDEKKD